MTINPERMTLRDGQELDVVSAESIDPASYLLFLQHIVNDSPMMGDLPGEGPQTVEEAAAVLHNIANSPTVLRIFCVKGMYVIGSADVIFGDKEMVHHRATLAVCVRKDFQGMGIGRMMFERAISAARSMPYVTQLELSVFTINFKAINMYRSFGFHVVGETPRAALLPDGTMLSEYHMVQ